MSVPWGHWTFLSQSPNLSTTRRYACSTWKTNCQIHFLYYHLHYCVCNDARDLLQLRNPKSPTSCLSVSFQIYFQTIQSLSSHFKFFKCFLIALKNRIQFPARPLVPCLIWPILSFPGSFQAITSSPIVFLTTHWSVCFALWSGSHFFSPPWWTWTYFLPEMFWILQILYFISLQLT